jgi:hypothetical protein
LAGAALEAHASLLTAAPPDASPAVGSTVGASSATSFGFGGGGGPLGTSHNGRGLEVVVTVLGAGKPPLVVAAEPSEGCGAFKKRLLVLLSLPAGTECKLIYAAHGKALGGAKTLAQFGVGHRAGLQLELLDGQVTSPPTSPDGQGCGGKGYGEAGGLQAFGTSATATKGSSKGSSGSRGRKGRGDAQGPSRDI